MLAVSSHSRAEGVEATALLQPPATVAAATELALAAEAEAAAAADDGADVDAAGLNPVATQHQKREQWHLKWQQQLRKWVQNSHSKQQQQKQHQQIVHPQPKQQPQ